MTNSTPVQSPGGEPFARRGAAAVTPTPPLSVVGIGASAGGLAALRDFFSALPADTGLVFVVVMHLSPDHESMLADLLQSCTPMPVTQVSGRVEMQPDHVYVIPPASQLVVAQRHLELVELDRPRGVRLEIDAFFRSLAGDHGDGAAIILSGAGSDGAVGIQGIKEGGGLILVQDPDEAEYDSMPCSAIATGLADIVAPAAELAVQLVKAKRSVATLALPSDPADLSEADERTLAQILAHLRLRMGHDFSGYKRASVLRRIGRRMGLAQSQTLSAYLHRLRQDHVESDALCDDLLIHVTEFFRDPEAWQVLAETVIPQLFAKKGRNDIVRAWTVGCATGEEAYGLAILLLEHAATLQDPPQIQLFASDLGEGALDYARRGVYPAAIADNVSEARLERFFVQENNHFRVRDDLRERVLFTPHNLLQAPPFSRLDLILCRNLLIYLQAAVQEQVFQIFHYALLPNGYLFLGSAETTGSAEGLFAPLDSKHRIYRRRAQEGGRPNLPALSLLTRPGQRAALPEALEHEKSLSTTESHRLMLEELAPPSMLVDENYNLLHLSETAGRYLQPVGGPFTRDLTQLVRPELQSELRMALYTAFAQERLATSQPVPVQFNGAPHPVSLLVRPNAVRRQALVIFLEEEVTMAVATGSPMPAQAGDAALRARIEQLEAVQRHAQQRWQAMREAHEVTVEELHAANEELQSTNEEYRATLEELETSKEELQSINEELQTLNMQLKDKVVEAGKARDDLQNLLTATEIAVLFLDRDLHLVRYTVPAVDLFNFMPADRGRPIVHLRTNLIYNELEADAGCVLETLMPTAREIESADGRWFQVNVRPYRTQEDKIDGVVITFFDITAIKAGEEALRQAKEYAESIVDTIPDALIVLEGDLSVRTANDTFYEMFGMDPEQAEGQLIYHLGHGQWDIPELRSLLEDVLPENNIFMGYEMKHEFGENRPRTMLLNGRRLDHVQFILLVITDITLRKEAEEALRQLNEQLEDRVEERTVQVRSLVTELMMSEQEERRRISGILHDNLQQLIYGALFMLKSLSETLGDDPSQDVLSKLADMKGILTSAAQTTRSLSVDLSSSIINQEELSEIIGWLATQMQQQHGLAVEVRTEEAISVPREDLRMLLLQTVRELLFNVVKHAGVSEAVVSLARLNGLIRIEVVDQGKGFDTDVVSSDLVQSQGLDQCRRRLYLAGGRLHVESSQGKGTRMVIECPMPNEISADSIS
jgi:two-component system, chemotaxis family, CheB/CheR fusion protein